MSLPAVFNKFNQIFKKSNPDKSSQLKTTNKINENRDDFEVEAILTGIKYTVLVIDPNKSIVYFNKGACELTGLTPDQALHKRIDQVIRFYANSHEIDDNMYADSLNLQSGPSVFTQANLKMVVSNGKGANGQIFVNLTSTSIFNKSGVHQGWVVTLRDVSVEKQVEDMKVGFVSIAAHELRTPLTSLKGYLSVFYQDYANQMNEDQKNLLDNIKSNTDRLLALVENLLDVSRVERGTLTLNLQNVNLSDVVLEVVEDFRRRANEKRVWFNYVAPTQAMPEVKIDKVRISEVLSNLLSNAINYTEPNGKVQIWIERQGEYVVTHVADTGIGIPKDAIPNLFTKFFRVTQGLTQNINSQGNGLGLYISKAIISNHQGKIWVNSEVGKGSVFSFALPIAV